MGAYIVTGLTGQEHVTSADDGAFNAGIVGTGKYVMKTAEQFAAEIVSNNIVRIKSGDLVNQGRHIRTEVNDYDDMTIENGTQSLKRNDLIVMRYKKDTSTNIELESAELVVIKGTAGAIATDPTYTSGNILAGATQDDFPLYRVSLNGLNIEKVTPLFSTVPNLDELNTKIVKYREERTSKGNNWSKSVGGLYYQNLKIADNFPDDAIILSAIITEWSGLSAQVSINVVNDKDIQLISNTYMPYVSDSSYIKYRVAYI